jgi:snurportin-1
MADDMESVLAAMSSTLEVTEESASFEHPRYSQYKNYGAEIKKQQARREDWLQRQQEGRAALFDKRRSNITQQSEEVSPSLVDENLVEMADKSSGSRKYNASEKPGSWRSAMTAERGKNFRPDLKGRIMYAEWLMDVPEDFAEKWKMLPVPKAKRVTIVFEKDTCLISNKTGKQLNQFKIPHYTSSTAIFDGFFKDKTVYILDFIKTGTFELEECDFECRRTLGNNFLVENHVLEKNQVLGKWKFELLEPVVDCTKERMEEFMSKPTPYELDGLLFYHVNGFYTPGFTPLVTWLKPWMLTDILDVPVNPIYLADATGGTTKEFIENFTKSHPTYGQVITKDEIIARSKMDAST